MDAEILWQEWRTAAQARLLAVQLIEGQREIEVQTQTLDLFIERSARLNAALRTGDATLAATAPVQAALQAARAQTDAAQRLQLARRHQLNALLNREPDAPIRLSSDAEAPGRELGRIGTVQDIVKRRPDPIALRLGDRAEEARVRQAILMQFPAFNLGAAGGSDNSDVRNVGPQIAVTLPLFDGARGDIVVQTATRDQLRAEYQARLNAAEGQLRAALSELSATEAWVETVRADLPAAVTAMQAAAVARNTGELDELAYVDLASAYFAKRFPNEPPVRL